MQKFLTTSLFVLVLGGCAMLTAGSRAPSPGAGDQGVQVVQPDRLKQGGTVLIIPFTAGTNVAETGALERIALGLVKGMAVAFDEAGTLRPVFGQEAVSPDFQLDGHITEETQRHGVRRWFEKPRRTLGVRGRMIDLANGQTVLVFRMRLTSTRPSEGFESMALRLGKRLAKNILDKQ